MKKMSVDKLGRTSLMYAMVDKDIQAAKRFVEDGGNLNLQDDNGWSALHFAAQSYFVEGIKLLLDKHVLVDLQDKHGNTPLSNAVFNSRGKGEIIKLLLEYGADRNLKNNYGVSPLSLAQSIGNYNIAHFFEK